MSPSVAPVAMIDVLWQRVTSRQRAARNRARSAS
jgi:hypothetical protein